METPLTPFLRQSPTPRSLEPAWWTNPAGIAVIGMPVSVGLTWLPWVPPVLAVVAMLFSLVVAVCAAVGYFAWPDSRRRALAEGAWVARQSGYQVDLRGHELYWDNGDGTMKYATVVRGDTGCDLILTDQNISIDVD